MKWEIVYYVAGSRHIFYPATDPRRAQEKLAEAKRRGFFNARLSTASGLFRETDNGRDVYGVPDGVTA